MQEKNPGEKKQPEYPDLGKPGQGDIGKKGGDIGEHGKTGGDVGKPGEKKVGA